MDGRSDTWCTCAWSPNLIMWFDYDSSGVDHSRASHPSPMQRSKRGMIDAGLSKSNTVFLVIHPCIIPFSRFAKKTYPFASCPSQNTSSHRQCFDFNTQCHGSALELFDTGWKGLVVQGDQVRPIGILNRPFENRTVGMRVTVRCQGCERYPHTCTQRVTPTHVANPTRMPKQPFHKKWRPTYLCLSQNTSFMKHGIHLSCHGAMWGMDIQGPTLAHLVAKEEGTVRSCGRPMSSTKGVKPLVCGCVSSPPHRFGGLGSKPN